MSQFVYNRHSSKSYDSQWLTYLQDKKHFSSIEDAINLQGKALEAKIETSSEIEVEAIHEAASIICGGLETGFKDISNELSSLGFQINEIAHELSNQLDWGFSMIQSQLEVSNMLSANVAQLLRIPDFQKERQYFIEQGLKHYQNAKIDPDLFNDALENLHKAEQLEKADYYVLHKLGMIYMYSKSHLNLELAESYFLSAAKYAIVETRDNSSITDNVLSKNPSFFFDRQKITISRIKAITSDSYFQAAKIAFINNDIRKARTYSEYAFSLNSMNLNSGYLLAKACILLNEDETACNILYNMINFDRKYCVVLLRDPDKILITNQNIIKMLEQLRLEALRKAELTYESVDDKIEAFKSFVNTLRRFPYLVNVIEVQLSEFSRLNMLTDKISSLINTGQYLHLRKAIDIAYECTSQLSELGVIFSRKFRERFNEEEIARTESLRKQTDSQERKVAEINETIVKMQSGDVVIFIAAALLGILTSYFLSIYFWIFVSWGLLLLLVPFYNSFIIGFRVEMFKKKSNAILKLLAEEQVLLTDKIEQVQIERDAIEEVWSEDLAPQIIQPNSGPRASVPLVP